MKNYAIAYAKYDGSDFHGQPWIQDGFHTFQAAERARAAMVNSGRYQRTFVFILPEDHPEEVSWEYAESHLVKE